MRWLVFVGLAACGSEVDEIEEPVCDGRQQPGEAFVDSPWDRDQDGFYDFTNLFCSDVYGLSRFDCDDGNPNVNAGQTEIACNGIDDDCSFDTPDGLDLDQDGANDCVDCDDRDPDRSPLLDDVCWDELDNDCDGEIDQGCGPNYNGSFDLALPIELSCDFGSVDLALSQAVVEWNPPDLRLTFEEAFPPLVLRGTVSDEGSVLAASASTFDCNQRYRFTGAFDGTDVLQGVLQARYGQVSCLRCPEEVSYGVEATRASEEKPIEGE